ncbi:MAG: ABC transporter permease subunit [Treponema sp.]|nr:ABC transporter permease subunit [Treponema sp.]
MPVIFRKEFRYHFSSMTGFVFLAVFWAASGVYFVLALLAAGSGDIKAFFAAFAPVLMFVLPLLTMRLYAEERNMRTEELLLSAPVSISSVILGKYAAAMAVFGIAVAPSLAFPFILAGLRAADFLSAAGCYTGLVLTASACISLGLLVSVCTESQTAAAAATYAVFLFMYLTGPQGGTAPSGFAGGAAAFFSLSARFAAFSYGVFSFADAFYYLSASALFIFLSVFALEDRRLA